MAEELVPTHVPEFSSEPDSRDSEVRNMLFALLCSLVDQEDEMQLLHVTIPDGTAFQVKSSPTDIGKLIGKKGRTAQAIRTILNASSAKNGRRYTLDITQ